MWIRGVFWMGDQNASRPKDREVWPVTQVGWSSQRIRDGSQEFAEIVDGRWRAMTPRSSWTTTPPAPYRRADSATRAPAQEEPAKRARGTREMWSSIHTEDVGIMR